MNLMLKSTLLGGVALLLFCSSFQLNTQQLEQHEITVTFQTIECSEQLKTALSLEKMTESLDNELQLQFIVSSANQVQRTKIRTIKFSNEDVAKGDCDHPELLIDQKSLFNNESAPEILDIKVRIL